MQIAMPLMIPPRLPQRMRTRALLMRTRDAEDRRFTSDETALARRGELRDVQTADRTRDDEPLDLRGAFEDRVAPGVS